MRAFYNEIDRYCCDWLQNLMDADLITPGKIDDRSIVEVSPDDVRGYERCHFFAGIAGWERAISLSGYTGPVWTGSCPCQPFSAAGKGKASGDERHLWPEWFRLIRSCKPATIFGEQVEAAIGWGWLDLVHSDLEPEGYAVGSTVLPACSVGAPHIRQRLWFSCSRQSGFSSSSTLWERESSGRSNELADAQRRTTERHGHYMAESQIGAQKNLWQQRVWSDAWNGEPTGELADADSKQRTRGAREASIECRGGSAAPIGSIIQQEPRRLRHDGWENLIWLPCTDGKQRPTQPGIFPLVDGSAFRMGSGSALEGKSRVKMLRAAGNCIVPQVAAEFIKCSMP